MDECFLSFKFNCGGKKENLSKAGSDRIKSVIDSSKVQDDGKYVELQQILNTSQNLLLGFTGTVCQHIAQKRV